MIDLNEIANECKKISDKRKEHGGVGSDVLKHCSGEVIEAVEAKKSMDYHATFDKYVPMNEKQRLSICDSERESYGLELADILICGLIAFAEEGLDVEYFLLKKMGINEQRAERQGDKL